MNDRLDFVKHIKPGEPGELKILNFDSGKIPETTIIIPSRDGIRDGRLEQLLSDIKNQSYRNFEVITVVGDNRSGRAINTAAAKAQGNFFIILDDDTRLGSDILFEKMVSTIREHPEIGMAGVSDIIPEWANWQQKSIMKQVPRRQTAIVDDITESDLAEHPCCIVPKKVFFEIGGENELIPRGVDPYFRDTVRKAGYKVVVLPQLFIHHLPSSSFNKFCRQFYHNGKMAAYVNKFYPQFVIELAGTHSQPVKPKRPLLVRVNSYIFRLLKAVISLQLYLFLSLVLYLVGYLIGFLFLKENDV